MKTKALAMAIIVGIICVTPPAFAESKSHWKRGMWIGAVSGAVAGGALGAGLSLSKSFCGANRDDFNFCNAGGRATIILGSAAGLSLVGLGLGAAIGAAIPKKVKVSVAPTLTGSFTGITGGGIGVQGTF